MSREDVEVVRASFDAFAQRGGDAPVRGRVG
jgi:hypothetical protein